jgi:hypothetical protein
LYALFARDLAEPGEVIVEIGERAKKSSKRGRDKCRPVAPYDKDLAKAAGPAFDRDTGLPVPATALKSYREVIAGYHLHPELKFRNGEPFDRGVTQRRYVRAVMFRNIGKEANEWEEQFYLGYDEEEQIDYGLGPKSKRDFLEAIRDGIELTGQRAVARLSGVSRRTIARFMEGEPVRSKVVAKIIRSLKQAS